MSWSGPEADRRQLGRDLASPGGHKLLRHIQMSCGPIASNSWQELEAEFASLDPRSAGGDRVVAALLQSRDAGAGELWQAALLLLFWPRLELIHRFKARWDRRPEVLWSNLC